MLKVLIADDEYKVGYLVKKLIEWEKLNLEFAGLVQDGLTAYKKICECAPDIVITDIRMPVLSGLELIKKVIDEGRSVHFIVISGYKYFEYAQQAIKYGVEDYLLKPIDEVELNQILKKISDAESSREKEIHSVDTMAKKLHDSRYILHREFLNSISGDGEMNLEEVNKNYGLNFGDGLFRVICCKLDGDIRIEKNEQQINLILKKTGALTEQALYECVQDIAITYQKNSAVTAVINYPAALRDEVERRIDRLFQAQMDYLSGFEHYELTMGLSPEYGEFGKLHMAVEAAREAVACRILGGAGRMIDSRFIFAGSGPDGYPDMSVRSLPQSADSPLPAADLTEQNYTICAETICGEIEEKLLGAVETARYDDIKYIIGLAFHEARKRRAFASEYYELAGRLFKCYLDHNPFSGEDGGEELREQWNDRALNCNSVTALTEYVTEQMITNLKALVEANQEKERKPVLNAVEYIKKNYSQKISLEEIAEQGGFNMNYFSELFKKETGKTFTAYVTDIRMEEAKKLLRDTEIPVYEVAESVGYRDSKFFSQQFVKNVGIKPVEYRKLYY